MGLSSLEHSLANAEIKKLFRLMLPGNYGWKRWGLDEHVFFSAREKAEELKRARVEKRKGCLKRRRKEAGPWVTGLSEGTVCQRQGCCPEQDVWSLSPSPSSPSASAEMLTSSETLLLCRCCIIFFRHIMSSNSHFTDEEIESLRVKAYKASKWQCIDSSQWVRLQSYPALLYF